MREHSNPDGARHAEYQATPKGDQQCSNCNLFQEPNACTLVDGEISAAGWCKFWVKKAG
jgi:High potential iron-sulfur protein